MGNGTSIPFSRRLRYVVGLEFIGTNDNFTLPVMRRESSPDLVTAVHPRMIFVVSRNILTALTYLRPRRLD